MAVAILPPLASVIGVAVAIVLARVLATLAPIIFTTLMLVFTETGASFVNWFMVSLIKLQLWMLKQAHQLGDDLISELGWEQAVRDALNALPLEVFNAIAYFNLDQVIYIILAAVAARIAMRMVPGFSF
jgi:hypothetical protein